MRFIRAKDLEGNDVAFCLDSIVTVTAKPIHNERDTPYVSIYFGGNNHLYLDHPFEEFMATLERLVK